MDAQQIARAAAVAFAGKRWSGLSNNEKHLVGLLEKSGYLMSPINGYVGEPSASPPSYNPH